MPKQSSNKKQLKHSLEVRTVEQQQEKPKKMSSEIDEIFKGKKRKRPENDGKAKTEKPVKGPQDGLRRIVKNGKSKSLKENRHVGPTSVENRPVGPTYGPRKKTADGLTVYTEEELGFGKEDAGGTRLCPFDCECCF